MGVTLKDWYDKDQVYDHDTFFVRDENGEIVQFTKGSGEPTLETLEVTENGTYTPSEGVDGFSGVEVNVPTPEVKLQDKTITENGTFTADSGYDGLRSVTVEVAGSGGGVERVTILQEQTVTPASDSNEGCYSASLSLTEKILENYVYEVCWDGMWYQCFPYYRVGKYSSATATILGLGNHKIKTKYYTSSFTWYGSNAPSEQFFIYGSSPKLLVEDAGNHTIRIDEIIISE